MLEKKDYCLRWESYKNSLADGFSKMQQMQEFIDVTLAAGDYLVGAHQNILALSSPYFKEMLKSAPCRHPVIYLGPINHIVLAFLLEYIYMGEVKIPSNILPSFIEASKMLHIVGVKDLQLDQEIPNLSLIKPTPQENNNSSLGNLKKVINIESQVAMEQLLNKELQPKKDMIDQINDDVGKNELPQETVKDDRTTCFAACIQIDNERHELSVQPITCGIRSNDDIHINDSLTNPNTAISDDNRTLVEDCEMTTDFTEFIRKDTSSTRPETTTEILGQKEGTDEMDSKDNCVQVAEKEVFEVDVSTGSGLLTIRNLPNLNEDSDKHTDYNNITGKITTALYTKSTRGNLQLILNRFIYNLHHTSHKGSKRRWRCIEYRQKRCPAYVDTFNEVITRKEMHYHPFHDSKIIKLGRKQEFYSSIARASNMFLARNKNHEDSEDVDIM